MDKFTPMHTGQEKGEDKHETARVTEKLKHTPGLLGGWVAQRTSRANADSKGERNQGLEPQDGRALAMHTTAVGRKK